MSDRLWRFLWWLMKPWVLIILLLAIAAPAAAQVSGPSFVFQAGTVINPDEVNQNFSDIYDAALNRFGGTVEGHLLWSPDATFDIGASGATRPRDLFLGRNAAIGGTLGVTGASTLAALSATTGSFSSTLAVTGAATLTSTLAVNSSSAAAIDVAGGITAGSGNVAIVDTTGKIPAISSTYFASLSGSNLTNVALLNAANAFSSTSTTTFAGSVTLANTRGFYVDNSAGTDIPVGVVSSGNELSIGLDSSANLNDVIISAGQALRFRTNSAERLSISSAGTLTHAGALVLTSTISPAALASGNNNDYAPTGFSTAYVVRLTANGGGSTLTGLAGGAAGREIVLCHVGGGTITVPAEDALSTAGNRFVFATNIDSGACSRFIYDGTSSRWRFVN